MDVRRQASPRQNISDISGIKAQLPTKHQSSSIQNDPRRRSETDCIRISGLIVSIILINQLGRYIGYIVFKGSQKLDLLLLAEGALTP